MLVAVTFAKRFFLEVLQPFKPRKGVIVGLSISDVR